MTWTGDGSSVRQISHNLGSVPGAVLVKCRTSSSQWLMGHRGRPSVVFQLNTNLAEVSTYSKGYLHANDFTDTTFTVRGATNANDVNRNEGTFVAYVFAHNDGDGEFGPTGDQDIIKCGSYTGDGAIDGPEVNLGFEPQWLLIKRSDAAGDWRVVDVMRGMAGSNSGSQVSLKANTSEVESAENVLIPTPTGWKINTNSGVFNAENGVYINMAIRRGSLAAPESATDVFDVTTWTSSGEPKFQTSFASDMAMNRNVNISYDMRIASRLTQGKFLKTSVTDVEASNSNFNFDYMNGFLASGGSSDFYSWQWKRAPSYFDVVAYTGNGVQGHNVSHNLGVAPDMMWVKQRSTSFINGDWQVYVRGITHLSVYGSDPDNFGDNPVVLVLNGTNTAQFSSSGVWDHTHPTDTYFRLGDTYHTNRSGDPYIAYLFATVAGVSKVGSYTGNGGTQTIDCGFSNGCKLFIVKRTNATGDWFLWDSARGISSGNDPFIILNDPDAVDNTTDSVDPDSSGIIVNELSPTNINVNNSVYVFYAVAN